MSPLRSAMTGLLLATLALPLSANAPSAAGGVAFAPSFAEAQVQAKERGLPTLLVVGAAWCHWCVEMTRTTWADPEVGRWIEARAVAARVDFEQEKDFVWSLKVDGFPTVIVFDGSREVGRIAGYQKPDALLTWLAGALPTATADAPSRGLAPAQPTGAVSVATPPAASPPMPSPAASPEAATDAVLRKLGLNLSRTDAAAQALCAEGASALAACEPAKPTFEASYLACKQQALSTGADADCEKWLLMAACLGKSDDVCEWVRAESGTGLAECGDRLLPRAFDVLLDCERLGEAALVLEEAGRREAEAPSGKPDLVAELTALRDASERESRRRLRQTYLDRYERALLSGDSRACATLAQALCAEADDACSRLALVRADLCGDTVTADTARRLREARLSSRKEPVQAMAARLEIALAKRAESVRDG